MLIRLIITLGACWIIFAYIDYEALLEILSRSDPFLLGVAFVTIFAIRIIMAARWYVILRSLGMETDLWSVIRTTLVSQSLGHLLPGGVSTDLVRIQQMHANNLSLHSSTSSVLLDRILGVASMFAVAFGASAIDALGQNRSGIALEIALASFALLFLCGVFFLVGAPVWRAVSSYRVVRILPKKLSVFLDQVASAVTDRELMVAVALPVSLLSLVVQVLRAAVICILFLAVGQPVELVHCIIFVPIVFVLMVFPVTIGGLGLREGTLAYFFSLVGVPAEASIATGLAFYLLGLFVLVPGFGLFLTQPKAVAKRSAESRSS